MGFVLPNRVSKFMPLLKSSNTCGGAPISIIKQYIENQNTPE